MKYSATALLLSSVSAEYNREQNFYTRLIGAFKPGACGWWWGNKPEPVGNFDKDRYEGTWFERQRSSEIFYEEVGETECVTATYKIDESRWFYPVGVNNRAMKQSTGELTNTVWSGDADGDEYARARFDEHGNGKVKFWFFPEGNYVVLDTDYDNYSIVYGCDNWLFGLFHY